MNHRRLAEWAEQHGGELSTQEIGLSGTPAWGPMIYQAIVHRLQPDGDCDPWAYGEDCEDACHNLIVLLKRYGVWWTAEVPQE